MQDTSKHLNCNNNLFHFPMYILGSFDDCTSSHPCGEDEGDCDNDDHCKGHLKCGTIKNGKGNCLELFPLSNFPTDAQCCYDPNW